MHVCPCARAAQVWVVSDGVRGMGGAAEAAAREEMAALPAVLEITAEQVGEGGTGGVGGAGGGSSFQFQLRGEGSGAGSGSGAAAGKRP